MSADRSGESLTPLQNAVFLLKQAQAKLAAMERASVEPIAIVGLGCRFPGAEQGPASFWRLLTQGDNAIREVPPDRWDIDAFYDPDHSVPAKMVTRWGGFLSRVDEFDAEFFGISPREAQRVDPQHRVLLEVAWEALEDAGIPPHSLGDSRTGVYVGVIGNDYGLLQSYDLSDMDVFSGTGASHAILANRLSYVLNLHGPSLTLDTACSSSLVTINLACRSLRARETDMGLAAGVNLILGPAMTLALSKAHMMSPDGRCKAFDAGADGYVRGEGCGVVVLKRMSDAIAAGDRILAVIRGSAVNHDGRSNGLSAPSCPAQEAVLKAALAEARLNPADISYVEAHGTGTRLGDPIEIEALLAALGEGRAADSPLIVSSVKTNIGHLESAAGIAGLAKVILMLRNRQIPKHLHLERLNPLLANEQSRIEIPLSLREWSTNGAPRRAGVSSFGFGGTNSHVILEEAPGRVTPANDPSAMATDRPRHLWTISARTPQALAQLAERNANELRSSSGDALADLAYTANTGRTHFAHRAAVIAESREQAEQRLLSLAAQPDTTTVIRGVVEHDRAPKIGFLFTGQGAQYAGMARTLYETQPTFRRAIDECATHLDAILDRPLTTLLSADIGTTLDQTGYTQPVMFAVEYALACLWRSWGIEPAVVMGHSVGEFAAACFAGVYDLADGLRLIARRAQLMQSLPAGGQMAAILASSARVRELLDELRLPLDIAADNGPENIVISGPISALQQALDQAEARGMKTKLLATSHAFHSHLLEPILEQLRTAAAEARVHAPTIPIISNLTGELADATTYSSPDYWVQHARQPVRFTAGMRAMVAAGCELFLEIGPNPILIGMGRRCVDLPNAKWLPSLRAGRDDWQTMLESLAELYTSGASIDWQGFDRDYARQRVSLPTYPFQRKRYWIKTGANCWDRSTGGTASAPESTGHPFLGHRLVAAVKERLFESQLTSSRPSLLQDHKVRGHVVMPGAAYLEMALAATNTLNGQPWTLRNVTLVEPLVPSSTPTKVQTIVSPTSPTTASFQIVSAVGTGDEQLTFRTHATGQLEAPTTPTNSSAATSTSQAATYREPAPVDITALRSQFTSEPRDVAWQAQVLKQAGLDPKSSYLWLQQHWYHNGMVLGEVRAPRETDHIADYQIHPGLLDSAFQALGASRPYVERALETFLPMSIERLTVWHSLRDVAWIVGKLNLLTIDRALGDVQFLDADGRVLAELERVQLRRVPRDWIQRLNTTEQPDWVHELVWQAASPISDVVDPMQVAHAPQRWLIFDCEAGIGAAVAKRLELKGCHCTVSTATSAEDRRAAVGQFLKSDSHQDASAPGILYLSGMDVDEVQTDHQSDVSDIDRSTASKLPSVARDTSTTTQSTSRAEITRFQPDFNAARDAGWGGLLDLLQGVLAGGSAPAPRLWIVTRGAQAAGTKSLPVAVAQSLSWGLGRVIASEHPELGCVRIDLDPRGHAQEIDQLTEELWWGGREDQVALRGEDRYVARLRSQSHRSDNKLLTLPGSAAYRLEIIRRGQLDQVNLVAAEPAPPRAGEVLIRVQTTGLNFRDILNVLDLYPGDPGALGGECVGEVVALGDGVTELELGDRVLALAPASFSSYVTIPAEFCYRCPPELSSTAAATIPISFLTCWYALRDIARLQPGERLLIHAGTGGVGLAALQIARLVGATVFATAGSQRKRDYLRSLGVTHVFDSRSTQFAQQILAATNQEGIDVVLNSLTGETIEASLSTLRAGGRFLELGKTDLWDQTRVDQVRPGVTFHAIALDELMADEPATIGRLFQNVIPHFTEQTLQPLPVQAYPIQKMVMAMRTMARAEHIGKLVIEAAQDTLPPQLWFRDDATYLVTGGLGGLGLRLAHWLAEHGARHIVLTSRSAASPEARQQIANLEQAGVNVVVQQCDIGVRENVEQLIATIAREMPPLRGVYHLAGVLDDGILREQNRHRFDRVLSAKALGAWYLHELTATLPLEQFVLFSSAASLLGSPGQGNYAAANAMLDSLAHARRAQGMPAASINWGSWSDVGMAARLKESQGSRWAEAGIGWIDPDLGFRTLEDLLLDDITQAGVLPMDWPKFFARIPAGAEPIWMSELATIARASKPKTEAAAATLAVQLTELTPSERVEHASSFLGRQAAQVLAMDENSLPDPRRPLSELGFDSLTGVEFCNRVSRAIGHALNPTLLFEYPTLESLAQHIIRDLLHLDFSSGSAATETNSLVDPTADQLPSDTANTSEVLDQVEGLTDEQMDALVLEQLEKLGALPAYDGGNPAETTA